MSIEIEKGIPIPVQSVGGRYAKYPWDTMEVGDSFFVPGITTVRFSMTSLTKRLKPKKFTARTMVKDSQNGVRVWRTA